MIAEVRWFADAAASPASVRVDILLCALLVSTSECTSHFTPLRICSYDNDNTWYSRLLPNMYLHELDLGNLRRVHIICMHQKVIICVRLHLAEKDRRRKTGAGGHSFDGLCRLRARLDI